MQQGMSSEEVLAGQVNVSLGGREVDPISFHIDREFSDSLPGGGSFTAASGDVSYVPGPDVSDRVSTPWDPTPGVPAPEAAVSVSMEVGLGPVGVLPHGRVASTNAGSGSRVSTVGFTDLYRSLDQPISWDGMAARMPAAGDAAYWRNPGLFGVSIVDRIFRHCGWYATPPEMSRAVVSAPMQGSAWAEVGTLTRAERLSVPGAAPGWITSQWGMQATDLNLTYKPRVQRRLSADGPMEVTTMIPPGSGTCRVVCWFGNRRIQLVWSDVQFFVSAETSADVFTNLVSLSRSSMGGAVAITARVERTSAGKVRASLRTNTGVDATGTITALTDSVMTTGISSVTVYGPGRCGAVQVAFPSSAWKIAGWEPSAAIHARAGIPNRLRVLPPVAGENCAKILQELSQAEYATFWIDEHGVMQWWDIDRLEAQPQVATLSTADHVTSLEWSHSLSSVYSRVNVGWKESSVSASFRERIDLWQGSGSTLSPGDDLENFINVPDDEVWLMPDLDFGRVGEAYSDYNEGIGSWYGAVADRGDRVDTWAQLKGSLAMTIERITDATFKTVTTWVGDVVATQKTLDAEGAEGTNLWRRRFDSDLPILRGKMRFVLVDETATSSQTGPPMAPEYTADCGWWIQYADEAQWLADKYASRVTVAAPEMSSVGIKPFPGLQLGDKITIRAPHVVGLQIQGLVYADSRSISTNGDDFSMSHVVKLRPISFSRDDGVTWEEWRASLAASITHTQWAGTQSGETWTQWGSAPLS